MGQKQIAQKASGTLTSIDLLRLRAMLMVIVAAGWDGVSKPSTSLQVLPPSGDINGAWPRLQGARARASEHKTIRERLRSMQDKLGPPQMRPKALRLGEAIDARTRAKGGC